MSYRGAIISRETFTQWLETPPPLWQTPGWADFRARALGEQAEYWGVFKEEQLVAAGQCFIGGNGAYCPRGPVVKGTLSAEILEALVAVGRQRKVLALTLDPPQSAPCPGFKPVPTAQPETTVVVDLQFSPDEILQQMKPKGRYNIRLAEKHGVVVAPSTEVAAFYQLLQETTARDGFSGYRLAYYQTMVDWLTAQRNGELLLASYQGRVLAGAIIVYDGPTAIYYYGASTQRDRAVMAPYLVQWTAMLRAKERGCTHYDFLGIAPVGATNHPWQGVTEFKLKFGGEVRSYSGGWQYVYRPWLWRMRQWAGRLKRKLRVVCHSRA